MRCWWSACWRAGHPRAQPQLLHDLRRRHRGRGRPGAAGRGQGVRRRPGADLRPVHPGRRLRRARKRTARRNRRDRRPRHPAAHQRRGQCGDPQLEADAERGGQLDLQRGIPPHPRRLLRHRAGRQGPGARRGAGGGAGAAVHLAGRRPPQDPGVADRLRRRRPRLRTHRLADAGILAPSLVHARRLHLGGPRGVAGGRGRQRFAADGRAAAQPLRPRGDHALRALNLSPTPQPADTRRVRAPNDAAAAVFDDAVRDSRARAAEPRQREKQL